MSLDLLQNMDDKTANSALAATVMSIGGPGLARLPEEYDEVAKLIIAEARRALKIRSDDESWDAYQKIRTFLSREVDRRLFATIDRNKLRKQMGMSGSLPISGYKIALSDVFRDLFKRESGKFATTCVQRADLIQHLLPDEEESNEIQFSLFGKLIKNLKKDSEYWAIVSALRVDDTLKIMAFWRIFPQRVEVDNIAQPTDILKSFLSSYGVDLLIEGRQTSQRLIIDRVFPNWDDPRQVVDTPSDGASSMELVAQKYQQGIRVALAYAVDHKAYEADYTKFA